MKKTLFVLAAFVLSVGVLPFADANEASALKIENTGPGSKNVIKIRGHGRSKVRIKNRTNVGVDNKTDQEATSGNAYVKYNTYGGDAETGDADNDNALNGVIDVKNDNDTGGCGDCGGDGYGGGGEATIENTGPYSYNKIKVGGGKKDDCRRRCGGRKAGTRIKNKTDIEIDNETDQEATTGNAYVKYNTEGGDATTGDASNDNETDIEIAVENNNDVGDDCDCKKSYDASIDTTGPKSTNKIIIGGGGGGGTDIENKTNIDVDNDTTQTATSGNAAVVGNTTGGSASTGNASNSNSTSFNFSVSNNN